MNIVVCPHCRAVRPRPDLPSGATIRCAGCAAEFTVPEAHPLEFLNGPRPIRPKAAKRGGFPQVALITSVAVICLVFVAKFLLSESEPRGATANGNAPIKAPSSRLFVVHLGEKTDGYYKGLVSSNNRIGAEMDWTTKADAMRLTIEEAKKTVEGMQKVMNEGGLYARLRIEPAE
jgi:hypothetical protein